MQVSMYTIKWLIPQLTTGLPVYNFINKNNLTVGPLYPLKTWDSMEHDYLSHVNAFRVLTATYVHMYIFT